MMFMALIMIIIFIFMTKMKRDLAKSQEDRRNGNLKRIQLENYDSSYNPGIVFI